MKTSIYFLFILTLISCSKVTENHTLLIDSIPKTKYYDNEIFTVNNLKLYDKWSFSYIYDDAGIAGGPGKVNPTYDFLELKEYGIYGKVKDNKIIESGKIDVLKQNDIIFEISLIKDNLYPNGYYYIYFHGNDSIFMIDATVGCGVLFNVYRRTN